MTSPLLTQLIWCSASKFLGVRRIFAKILANLQEKIIHKKKWPSNKSSSCYFGPHFCLYFQGFAQIFSNFVKVLRDFSHITSEFAQIFTKSKLLEVRLHLYLLHQCSTVTKLFDATWYLTRISDLWNCCQTSRWKHHIFFSTCLKKPLNIFLKNLLGDQTFSSSPNASPRSALNFTTKTKRCTQRWFLILFALIDLTG